MKNNEKVCQFKGLYIRESLLPQLSKAREKTGDTPSMIINDALIYYFNHILQEQGEGVEEFELQSK